MTGTAWPKPPPEAETLIKKLPIPTPIVDDVVIVRFTRVPTGTLLDGEKVAVEP